MVTPEEISPAILESILVLAEGGVILRPVML
jgi:hypothetical protein